MLSRQEFLDSLKELNPNYNLELLGRAYDAGLKAHAGQLRKSGEPYFIHPIAVAEILAELGMDEDTLVACLLHDALEDTDYTQEQLTADFGKNVAAMVDGVTKLKSLKFESTEERQAENLRKMFLAMSKDIRVLLIKLADRVHNMRTINYMTDQKITEKSRESLEIYAPLASRLGIYTMKFELEDIAFKQLYPKEYEDITKKLQLRRDQRLAFIDKVMDEMRESLNDMDIHYELQGRSKHYYSIYKKMIYQHKQLDEIFDLNAVRVIVDTVRDCYAVLGTVHTMWKPIPGKFKDYIAMPKPNMYQSLHTTVIGDYGDPFEIQIRTYEMHRIAEYGIAAHWKYKEGISKAEEETKLAWLRQTLELQKENDDPMEFMETLKLDLFSSQVFVFTPRGEVIELPAGSTPLDFAFKIHSAIGFKCIGARVNGRMVPIDYTLENGNIVEIVTSANSPGPSTDWLKVAKSSNARSKIRAFLKKENKSDNVEKGKDLLDKFVRKKGYEIQPVVKNTNIVKAVKQLGFTSAEDLYNQISYGGAVLSRVGTALIGYYNDEKQTEAKKAENDIENIVITEEKKKKKQVSDGTGVIVKGEDNLLVRLSKCCHPVPGDEIVGFITMGRGVSVHRKDCSNMKALMEAEPQRVIEVEWDQRKANKSYNTDFSILAEDKKGLFTNLSRTCEEMDVHIAGVNAKTQKDNTVLITMTLSISNTNQMERVLRNLKNVPNVIAVTRSNNQ